jgi:FkbM family methyltransferase
MSAKNNIFGSLKSLDRFVWSFHRIVVTRKMADILSASNLTIADVGASGGVGALWKSVEEYSHFVTFEPDARSKDSLPKDRVTNFSVGLGAVKGEFPLYLAKFPPASSLYKHNQEVLGHFANHEGHEIVGSSTINVDTLDNCIADKPDLKPDFLKVDVEGADLDVLRGASRVLASSVMGVCTEVTFQERYLGAPSFGAIDTFLKEQGFSLFILSREHWLRNNLTYGSTSHPQVIWADAVYFLAREAFMHRLEIVPQNDRVDMAVKFIVLLLAYGCHDYAIEIIDAVSKAKLVPQDIITELRRATLSSVDSSFLFILLWPPLILFILVLYVLSLPSKAARSRLRPFLRLRMSYLFHRLLRMTANNGPADSCIPDHL